MKGKATSCRPYGSGHINTTYLVKTDSGIGYILQRLNSHVFHDIPALMANVKAVTEHLQSKDSDPRHSLHLIQAMIDGANGLLEKFMSLDEGQRMMIIKLAALDRPEHLIGRAIVVSAIQTAARAAVLAAKAELKIQLPSGVFRDEVGRMAINGHGQGALLDIKAQARVIQNATRFLIGAAQAGVDGSYSYDNRKTYNQNDTSTIRVDRLYVRDDQDVRSLAIEIVSLTRRQQRGKGLRMA